MSKHKKIRFIIHYVKSTAQPVFLIRFPKGGPTCSTVLNPIFSKKVQGQKHPGRWGIVEHQIPSIKVLFKTYTKGHKHPGIRLISKSKTQLVNQRKQKVAFSPGIAHSPEIQSYRTWWGATSPTYSKLPYCCSHSGKSSLLFCKMCNGWFHHPGGHLNKKDGLTRYGDSHVKDKTS